MLPQNKREIYYNPSKKPEMLRVKPDGIAQELRNAVRFVLWVLVLLKAKWAKVPKRANGHSADITDPNQWGTFASIHAAYAEGGYDGIGFALGDGFAGIDLDNCRDPDTGELEAWARRIVDVCGTYAEVSPSGTGLKLIGRGKWEGDWHKKPTEAGGEIEIYDSSRYFALTGHRLNEHGIGDITQLLALLALEYGEPPKPPRNAPPPHGRAAPEADDAEILRRAMAAKNGAKFSRLWLGDASDYDGDESRADLALCGLLAFYCGLYPERIDRLFRQSKLFRPKWDDKRGASTYGRDTVGKALEGRTEFHNPTRAGEGKATNGSPASARPSATANIPEYRAFPADALPPLLREFAEQVAASVGCDLAFAALPALTLAGAAVGAAVVATPKRGWREPPGIWACAVGDSGTGKSPAAKDSSSLGFRIDRELREAYCAAMVQYKRDCECYAAKMADFDSAAGGEEPEKPRRPKREYFAVVDFTIERLAEMLGDSPRGLLVMRDELAGWFGSFSRYKGKGGGTDVPNWLSLFDCGPIRVHRRTGEPRDIETDRAFAAVFGGIQPDILARYLAEPGYVESGLAARILFAAPPKLCPGWSDAELDGETERRFGELLRALRSIPYDSRRPAELRLDYMARERFKRLNNEFAERAENVDGGPMSSALPKAVRYALRFALIHHCVTEAAHGRDPARGCIAEASMIAGETLSRWFVYEAERVYATMGEKPEERATRHIDGLARRLALRNGGAVRPRDLQRANAGKYPTAEIAEAALDSLATAGLGTWRDSPGGKSGGRPTRVYIPRPHGEPDGRQNPTEAEASGTAGTGERSDTTPADDSGTPADSTDDEVVSGSVGRRADDAGATSSPQVPEPKPEVPSDTPKREPRRNPRSKPDPLFGDGSRGLPD